MNKKAKTPTPGSIFINRYTVKDQERGYIPDGGAVGGVKNLSVSLDLSVCKQQLLQAITAFEKGGDQYYALTAFKNDYKKDGEDNSPDYKLRFKKEKGASNGAKAAVGQSSEFPI